MRRIFLLYGQRDQNARWERLAVYAFAFGVFVAIGSAFFPGNSGPDSKMVYTLPVGAGYGSPVPLRLPDAAPGTPDGFPSNLGEVRRENGLSAVILLLLIAGARIVIFAREWRWMTPLSGDPHWLRRQRARMVKRISEENDGLIPKGIFRSDIPLDELKAEAEHELGPESLRY